MEEKSVELVARYQSPEGLEPADGALDDPAFAIAPQRATILSGWSLAATAVWADELDTTAGQSLPQRITVCSSVIDEPLRNVGGGGLIEQWLDQRYFRGTGSTYVDGQWQAVSIDQDHELAALAALGRTNTIAPFFAGENEPSANPSLQLICPCSSSRLSSRSQMRSQTPLRDHSANRRQHVTYEGNERGRSFQRAPLRRTQRMPSRHCLASALGRPPRASGWGAGKRSEINDHCSSLSCGVTKLVPGSILDPALTRDRSVIRGLLSSPNTQPKQTAFS